ncbi:MAG: hypothetical protein O3B41_03510 [Bacteroidetes bacterium]|nr:hypothetical protein [Bacteroidota bacterium]
MFSSLGRIVQVLSDRQKTRQRGIHWAVLTTSFVALASIGLSLYLTPEGADLSYQFIEEGAFNTYFSSLLLSCGAVFMFATYTSERIAGSEKNGYWLVLAAGLAFLSVDEIFKIHHQINAVLTHAGLSSPIADWTDFVGIIYGVVALSVMWVMLPKLVQIRSMPELLAVAFLFYLAHTLADSLVRHNSDFTHIAEESLKLFSSAFLMLASYSGLVWTLDRTRGRRAN